MGARPARAGRRRLGTGLLLAKAFLPWRPAAAAAAVLATLALPLEAVYAFDRLFAVNGTNGSPVTLDQAGVFSWLDRHVGGRALHGGEVPRRRRRLVVGAGVLVGRRVLERECGRDDGGHVRSQHAAWPELFDPRTGAAHETLPTRYALFYGNDVRFRLAGIQHTYDRGAYIVEPERPWRADWVARGSGRTAGRGRTSR